MTFLRILFITFWCLFNTSLANSQVQTPRSIGLKLGVLSPGKHNAITDVNGVTVGHTTLIQDDNIRTGVTAILPYQGNIFQQKVPAAIYIGNGFGKLTGYSQVEELGNLETPIILTNTLSVPTASDALIDYTFSFAENKEVFSVNPVVGETNDSFLNDIRDRYITKKHVLQAIRNAKAGKVSQGNVGAGTGTICFGYKGGIGTASRVLPKEMGGFTVGVLVQTNYGGILQISGLPVGPMLDSAIEKKYQHDVDGSCMVVIATDAPLDARNLKRLAKRAMLGLGRTGGIASNGSGEYIIAFSTEPSLRVLHQSEELIHTEKVLNNDDTTPIFLAAIEATEEAVFNALFAAETMVGRDGHIIEKLPVEKLEQILKEHKLLGQ